MSRYIPSEDSLAGDFAREAADEERLIELDASAIHPPRVTTCDICLRPLAECAGCESWNELDAAREPFETDFSWNGEP